MYSRQPSELSGYPRNLLSRWWSNWPVNILVSWSGPTIFHVYFGFLDHFVSYGFYWISQPIVSSPLSFPPDESSRLELSDSLLVTLSSYALDGPVTVIPVAFVEASTWPPDLLSPLGIVPSCFLISDRNICCDRFWSFASLTWLLQTHQIPSYSNSQ